MPIFYSPSRHAFLDDTIHDSLPDDAVEITATRHRALLKGQATGASIVAGEDGRPRLHRPRVTIADQRATLIRKVKREAARRIERISPFWRQLNDHRAPTDEAAGRFAAIDAVRAASNQIEAEIAAADASSLKQFDIVGHSAWLNQIISVDP